MEITILLLVVMTIAALYTVMARSLLKGTIGLALTSAALSIVIFKLNSPLAAVFELSVCTGLITAVFASAISLTKPMTHSEVTELTRNKLKRYWYLPVIMIIAGVLLSKLNLKTDFNLPSKVAETDVRNVMWNLRQLDMLGQIVILLAGAFGIVILFKETKKR